MSDLARITLVVSCTIPMCGCHSKNLGVPESKLLNEALPQHYIIAESPPEAFRALSQAVVDTPHARLLVSDESSGIITWLLHTSDEEIRQHKEREDKYLRTQRGLFASAWIPVVGAFVVLPLHRSLEKQEEAARQAREQPSEAKLTVGRPRGEFGGLWEVPEFVICTVRIRPEAHGSRVQIRRAWWNNGQLDPGMPQSWLFESETLARAGLRVAEAKSSD